MKIAFVVWMAMVLTAVAARADEVVIIKNSDSKQAISYGDWSLVDRNARELEKLVTSLDPSLSVRIVSASSVSEALREVVASDQKLRALVFVGHGNNRVFALNKQASYDGKVLALLLRTTLSSHSLADKFTIYFSGCSMADRRLKKPSFLEVFYDELEKGWPKSERFEVMAHVSMTAGSPFSKTSSFDRFSFKAGIGRIFERLTILQGHPAFMAVTLITLPINLQVTSSPLTNLAVGLSLFLVKEAFERGLAKFGTRISRNDLSTGSVYDFLQNSFAPPRCQSLFSM